MSDAANLQASIRQRLLNQARATNRPYNELLQYYVIERFLYRISKSNYSDKLILKGALMFRAWGTSLYRPTRDIDLLGLTSNELDVVQRIIQEICELEVGSDGLIFDHQTILSERINEDADYKGVRIRLSGYLGKSRIPLQIDIGFSDVVSPAPVPLQYPTLLSLPSPYLYGYSADSVIAEKLQALVFLGSLNSRMKDYYDLWILASQSEFDGRKLQQAIVLTFQRRKTILPVDVPVGLSDTFAAQNQARWSAFIRRNHFGSDIGSFSEVVRMNRRFLLPPLQAGAMGSSFAGLWKPGGPWVGLA